MKKIISILLLTFFISAITISCTDKKKKEDTKAIEKIEASENEIENETKKLEEETKELESSLDELDNL